MADAPATETKPDAATQPVATPDAAAKASTAPAAETKPAPAATPAPPEFQDIDFDQPIEWDGQDGKVESATLRQLIDNRKKYADLGVDKMDPADMKAIMGAIRGDPDATRQILQNEIDKLTPRQPEGGADFLAQNDRIAALEASNKRAMSAVETLDDARLGQVVTAVMGLGKAKEMFPHLIQSGPGGARLLSQFLKPLMQQRGIEAGTLQSDGRDLILHACQSAENHISSLIPPFGPSSDGSPGAAPAGGVPEPGGNVGGDIAAGPAQERKPVTRAEALQGLRAQRAAGE
jgi:hypothetical protein